MRRSGQAIRTDDPLKRWLRSPEVVERRKNRQEGEDLPGGKPTLSRRIGPRAGLLRTVRAPRLSARFYRLPTGQLLSLIRALGKIRALFQSRPFRFPPGRQPKLELSGTLSRFFVGAGTQLPHAAGPDLGVASLLGSCRSAPSAASNRRAPALPRVRLIMLVSRPGIGERANRRLAFAPGCFCRRTSAQGIIRRPSGTPNLIRREALPCRGSNLGRPGERADLVLYPGRHAISDASE